MSDAIDPPIDFRLIELLSSRLCHDLVGPIGAVNNGMELMLDEEFQAGDDAIQLVTRSARQTSDLLQFYRLAYGSAGGQVAPPIEELFTLAGKFLVHARVTLDWAERGTAPELPRGAAKLLLNLVALAQEGLPRGGEIRLLIRPRGARLALDLVASGTDAGFRDEVKAGLTDGVAVKDLSPRSVQGYFTRLLAARLGSRLVIEQPATGAIRLSLVLGG